MFLFFLSTIFDIFSLTHKREEVWLDGTHPMLFAESSWVCMLQKGVWPYRYAYDVPLVTLILILYGFVGLAPLLFFF